MFTEALNRIIPGKSQGLGHVIWIKFAKFYEDHKDISNANKILHKAVEVDELSSLELGQLYLAWAEMHIRCGNSKSVVTILRYATSIKSIQGN